LSKRSAQGSLLIEALLTAAIMTMSLALIVQSLMSSYRGLVYSSGYTIASILTENKLFEIFSRSSKEPTVTEAGSFEEPFRGYSYDLEIQDLSGDEAFKSLQNVDLDVSWLTHGKRRGISIQTYHLKEEE
jgi:Tfp pilus assembly protein PilV